MNDLLEKSKALKAEYTEFLERNLEINTSKPNVAVWGLMNAGKSSLLNMLTQHVEQEFFKTNDFRETTEVSIFEDEKYCFIDTPGLDANDEDDAVALAGIEKADIIIFVHQLQGELEEKEINFLKQVRASFGEYAEQNIILVLSKVDKAPAEDVETIKQATLAQCEAYLGFKPTCLKVSNTYYKIGILKDKEALVKNSQIQQLHECLEKAALLAENVRSQRCKHEQLRYIEQLNECNEQLKQIFESKKTELNAKFADFVMGMKRLQKTVKTEEKRYLRI